MQQALHERSRGDDHRFGLHSQSQGRLDSPDSPTLLQDPQDVPLQQVQIGLRFHQRLHPKLIRFLVTLSARSADTWPFVPVQRPKLDSCGIGIQTHDAAQGVDLPHHVTLGQSAHRWITGHLADGIQILR